MHVVFDLHFQKSRPRVRDVKRDMTFSGDRRVDGGTSNESGMTEKGGKGRMRYLTSPIFMLGSLIDHTDRPDH